MEGFILSRIDASSILCLWIFTLIAERIFPRLAFSYLYCSLVSPIPKSFWSVCLRAHSEIGIRKLGDCTQ